MEDRLFATIRGRAMWERCDHDQTRIEGSPARICLAAEAPEDSDSTLPLEDWEAARGAAALLPCAPDGCADHLTLLVDPRQGWLQLADGEWLPLERPGATDGSPTPPQDPLRFSPPPAAMAPAQPSAIARDPWQRLWLLERRERRLQRLGADLRLAYSLSLPGREPPLGLSCSRDGVVVGLEGPIPQILFKPWRGEWRGWNLEEAAADGGRLVAVAADPELALVAGLLGGGREGPRLVVLQGDVLRSWPLPAVRRPLHLVLLAEDRLLVSDLDHGPGDPRRCRFREVRLTPRGPEAERGFAVRGFDGRALWRQDGQVLASTATGARALFPFDAILATRGRVETWALDSGRFACQWHRLFLDGCLPADGAVKVEARTSDDLPPLDARRPARPPADQISGGSLPKGPSEGATEGAAPQTESTPWPPLGSLQEEAEEGWVPLGVADRRTALADVPLPPHGRIHASEDPLAPMRGESGALPDGLSTLEWLITAPPGRYLWLRLHLEGTRRRGPELLALRASFPRPSLLDYLPAYWREDPEGGRATEEALALFEGWITELEQRNAATPQLLSPALTPPDLLPWLADFLALSFDDRVSVPVRRQLLAEIAELYRARGTVPGLGRLLSILAEAPVRIVEGFRLRSATAGFVGQAVMGPGLELGGREGPFGLVEADATDQELAFADAGLRAYRAAQRQPCPAAEPPNPLPSDPLLAFYRRHAHRFTVVVQRCQEDALAAVLEQALEASKPAHTLHRICWVDGGYRLGRSSFVGLSGPGPSSPSSWPAVLDRAVLGGATTVGSREARSRAGPPEGRDGHPVHPSLPFLPSSP